MFSSVYVCYFGMGLAGWCAYTWIPFHLRRCFVGCVACVWHWTLGCTNNNYASRKECKKCGQPKEVAAMPAIAMPGASLPTYSHYFSRPSGALDQKVNYGLSSNGALQLPPAMLADNYVQSASTWSLGGNHFTGLSYANPASQPPSVPKGWRNGDWMCNCGYHNYSSRTQCKSCDASMPSAIGTKRLASEEFVHDWENKRLNCGNAHVEQQKYPGIDQILGTTGHPRLLGVNAPFSSVGLGVAQGWQMPVQFPHQTITPPLLGKGAKQWRNGDWMCTNCNNHNYASRAQCNRCKTQRDGDTLSVSQPVNSV